MDGVSTGIGSTCSPAHDYGSAYYTANGPADFAQWTAFTISGTGSQGTNDLDFVVWNSSPAYTALRVEFTPTPEPGTLALMRPAARQLHATAGEGGGREPQRLSLRSPEETVAPLGDISYAINSGALPQS